MSSMSTIHHSNGTSTLSDAIIRQGSVKVKTYLGEDITIFVDQTRSGSICISVRDGTAVPYAAQRMPEDIEDIGRRQGKITHQRGELIRDLTVRDGSNFRPNRSRSGTVHLSDGISKLSNAITGAGSVQAETYSGQVITIFVYQTKSGSIYISVGDSYARPDAVLEMPENIEKIGKEAGIIP